MRKTLMLAACLLLAICGCQRSGDSGWGAAHELRIAIVSDPSSLNPLFVTSQNSVDMGQLYTETLVGLAPDNRVVPLLATAVPTRENGGISRDGLTLTYRLRRDAWFADGTPLTSRDVAFTYRVILDARNPVTSAAPYKQIAKLDTPDAYTVRIRLRRPWAAATSELFAESDYAYGILPEHVFGNSTDISRSSWNEHPFGSGPFRVVEWRRGDRIVLEPNPHAWRKPRLKRLMYKIVPDANTRFVQIRTHAVDVADLIDKEVPQARALPGVRVIETQQNHTDFIEFQTQSPALRDVRVRRAIIEAIDRDAILRKIFLGLHPLATTEIPASLWAHDSSIQPLRYDPDQAKRDLKKAGAENLQLQFAYIGSSETVRLLATQVQADLARVGVSLILRSYPSTLFYAAGSAGGITRGGRFDLTYSDWYGGADPEQSETYRCADLAPSGPNVSRWCNERYDAAFRAQAQSTNRAVRIKAFSDMQRLVRDNAVADFLTYQSQYTALNPAVRNYTPNMVFACGNADQWDVAGT